MAHGTIDMFNYAKDEFQSCTNLAELLAALNGSDSDIPHASGADPCLPVFGKQSPVDTWGVWSWNDTHVITVSLGGKLAIKPYLNGVDAMRIVMNSDHTTLTINKVRDCVWKATRVYMVNECASAIADAANKLALSGGDVNSLANELNFTAFG